MNVHVKEAFVYYDPPREVEIGKVISKAYETPKWYSGTRAQAVKYRAREGEEDLFIIRLVENPLSSLPFLTGQLVGLERGEFKFL